MRLRAKGAFVVSSEQHRGTVWHVTVTSDKGNRFALANPWGSDRVSVVDGKGRPVSHTVSDGIITFPTKARQTYRITTH